MENKKIHNTNKNYWDNTADKYLKECLMKAGFHIN